MALRYPMDIPCSVCGQPAGAPCVYWYDKARSGQPIPGYHSQRKYDDLPAAMAAEQALLGE